MKKHYLIAGLVAVGALTGCSKDPLQGMTQEESRIYITNHDSTARFGSYATFTISDSVTVINNNQVTRQQTTSDIAFISALRAEMQGRGYTMVNRTDKPDLAVNVNRIYNTSTGVINYGNYWGNYGGFYDPWMWGYGGMGFGSPFGFATYSITEGALSIDILDLKNASANNRINGIWSGLIRGSGIFNANTAASQVKQLFEQSPYLRKNQ
ncbi:DUF4136 domain-containing protein [Aridibaculum aurantiacum]|uniref:DUF4136 domain-containing protein n=1 Tax=Aridibaculum aurantiacum TaxID=2810307 RepID=UPI001A9660D4|nr:DUF4136 domain-containing protein [Aridibaculum aurantiacum]